MAKVIERREAVPEVKLVTEVTPETRFIDIPKTKITSITGRKSIVSEDVILEESKEFVVGENAGWLAANKLTKDFPVSEEDDVLGELIDKAHYDPYASSIPKYILEGAEDQHDAYGMGFDVGVRAALQSGLEATPVEAITPVTPEVTKAVGKIDRVNLSYKSFDEINALREAIESDPANQTTGFYKYTPQARKKLSDIAWAIANKMERERGIPKAEPPAVEGKPKAEKTIRLTVRPKTYRGEVGFTVKGKQTDIFFEKESQAREYVKRVKAGEKPDKILSDIWKIKQVRSGYTTAELMRIHAQRSPLSRASDERQSHQVTIEPESLKVKSWISDPGKADISGIDTPPITKRSSRLSGGRVRITPKTPRLRR